MRLTLAVIILSITVLLFGCGHYYSDEVITDKRIEVEEWYKKGKKYSENRYILVTDNREYIVDSYAGADGDEVYYSYNIGDRIIFMEKKGRYGLKVVINER